MKKISINLVLLTLLIFANPAFANKNVNIYSTTRDLPNISIKSPDGTKLDLKKFKGDFVILVVWSRFCAKCVNKLESIKKFISKTENNGIELVLLSDENEWKDVAEQKAFLKKYGAEDINFYLDPNAMFSTSLGIFKYPSTVLINSKSQEIGRIKGSLQWDDNNLIEYIYKLKAQHG